MHGLAALMVAASCAPVAFGASNPDVVEKLNGQRFKCTVLKKTDQYVTIKIRVRGGGSLEMRVFLKDIRALTKGGVRKVLNAKRASTIRKPAARSVPKPAKPTAWPKNYSIYISFKLINSWKTVNPQKGKKMPYRRHYTSVWIEDSGGKMLRTIVNWAQKGKNMRYIKQSDTFWAAWQLAGRGKVKGRGGQLKRLSMVTRASRPTGSYTVVWDGKDDQGRPVPRGRYTVHIDVNREFGPPRRKELHTHTSGGINCGARTASIKLPDKPELGDVKITYGPSKR